MMMQSVAADLPVHGILVYAVYCIVQIVTVCFITMLKTKDQKAKMIILLVSKRITQPKSKFSISSLLNIPEYTCILLNRQISF